MGRIDIGTKQLQNEYLYATDDTTKALQSQKKCDRHVTCFRQDTFLVIIDTLISELSLFKCWEAILCFRVCLSDA